MYTKLCHIKTFKKYEILGKVKRGDEEKSIKLPISIALMKEVMHANASQNDELAIIFTK